VSLEKLAAGTGNEIEEVQEVDEVREVEEIKEIEKGAIKSWAEWAFGERKKRGVVKSTGEKRDGATC
jgi:hypothetical protein